ncbi:MAG TPA: rhodanese-like domain-containing protein [Alphaproteobacteria bacterium]|jgi:rhodanese-related sulfurtransferase|nr:rhodanese-like domain-containing protein [Alphaproteobacteria bacterium]
MTADLPIRDLTPADIHAKLQDRSIVLIDVREPDEHRGEHIAGALLHPLSTFDPAALPDVADRDIVFHCGSGKRSAMAVAKCREQNLAHKSHMAGGIQAWKAAGLPTVVAKTSG